MSAADDVLTGLDPDQREIAETLRGPVAVLAGAGTGKTRAITHRIAYGVRSGVYAADRVLAVTFTRKAAGELRGRLRQLGVEGVTVHTFHGAALAQLGHFWPQIVGGSAPEVLPGKVAALSQAASSLGLNLSSDSLRDIASEIEWRKVSLMSIDDYAKQVEQRTIPSGVSVDQLVELHRSYQQLLQQRRQIDFEDVLVLTAGMIEAEPRAALQVHERYRFFTVDEFQDVSPVQHALLRVWLGGRDELCVVGDASQTIYSFAGASSAYLLRFGVEYPHARVIRLERNYRSIPRIVRMANTLMRDKPGALTLRAVRGETGRGGVCVSHETGEQGVSFEWFESENEEAEAVAQSISAAIAAGVSASQIAVLYRSHAQSLLCEQALRRQGVGVRVHGAQRFFDRADVRQAVMLIRGEAKTGDRRPLFQIVSDALRAVGWTAQPPEDVSRRERWEVLNALLSLVDQMPSGASIGDFSEELLARQRAQHEPTVDAVTLCAVHAAKGLEWSLVHVVGLCEGVFPMSYARDDAAIEEERRLAYVALTRAQDMLRLSGSAGVGRLERLPSRFVSEAGIVV